MSFDKLSEKDILDILNGIDSEENDSDRIDSERIDSDRIDSDRIDSDIIDSSDSDESDNIEYDIDLDNSDIDDSDIDDSDIDKHYVTEQSESSSDDSDNCYDKPRRKKHKKSSDCSSVGNNEIPPIVDTINDEPSNNEPGCEIASTSTTANTKLTASTTPVISITPRGRERPRKWTQLAPPFQPRKRGRPCRDSMVEAPETVEAEPVLKLTVGEEELVAKFNRKQIKSDSNFVWQSNPQVIN